MASLLRAGRRQPLKTAAHSFGAVVAITLVGILVGALAVTAHGMTHGNVGTTGDDFGPIAYGGLNGAVTGGTVGSGVLAISVFFKGPRRKMVAAGKRVSRCLNGLAILGGCLVPTGTYFVLVPGPWEASAPSLGGNITLLTIYGVAYGVAAGVALGLIIGLLTVLSLAVAVLVRISAGFLHSARKRPESVSADLIDGACDPWPIRAAAALMPPEAGQRWRDDFNEAHYDYDDDQHAKLLRDFLLHAPAVFLWAWIAALQRHVRGVGSSRKHQW